jgi:hypothetical protein
MYLSGSSSHDDLIEKASDMAKDFSGGERRRCGMRM